MKRIICCLIALCLLAAFVPAGAESPAPAGKPWINSNIYGNWPSGNPGPEESFDLYINYDFYQSLPADSDENMITAFGATAKIVNEDMKTICTDPEKTGTEEDCLRILYGLYMDTEKRAQDGFSTLKAHADRLHAVKTADELMALIREEGYLYGEAFFNSNFSYGSTSSQLDPEMCYLKFDLIPIIDDLPPDEETGEIPGKDTDGARNKLLRMGWSEEEISQLMDKLIAASDLFTDYSPDTALENELISRDGLVSLNEIREVFPQVYEFIAAQGFSREGTEAEQINLIQAYDLNKVVTLFREENLETIKAALALGMYKQAERILPNETEDREAVDFESFLSFVPRAVTEQAFVHSWVPQERIDMYRQLVDEYKEAMRVRIGQNSRLSEESKKEALNKIDHLIASEILYPYGEIDCSSLLDALRSCGNLLEANGACRQLERKALTHFAGLKMDRGNRYMTGESALFEQGKYMPMNNAFFIGGGALLGEMADFTSRETLLATLGFHLGHEMSHGFDIYGATFDAFGNQFEEGTSGYLFTEEDRDDFAARARIIAGQISQTDMWDGNNLPGEAMIGEAMADLTSVQLAMDMAKQTEGFDYDTYFRTFAKAYYQIYHNREYFLRDYTSEVHPPNYFRVNFTVAHFDEFYQTYPSVREGTPMYIAPEDRVMPW